MSQHPAVVNSMEGHAVCHCFAVCAELAVSSLLVVQKLFQKWVQNMPLREKGGREQ